MSRKNCSSCLYGRDNEGGGLIWCVEMSVLMPEDWIECEYWKSKEE